ncbi:MAG: sensor domain-containing protein [Thermomicrobiaceae bacterium]|nr:sensor domain-containing protein [Thermomicrobiaceae bacterium]
MTSTPTITSQQGGGEPGRWTLRAELASWLGWRSAQVWRDTLYLLLSFPLGIAYFVFLATGIALGAGLAVTLLGLPLLALMMVAWRELGALEWALANGLLRAEIPARRPAPAGGLLARLKATLRDSYTWRSLAYLLVECPFGVAAFTVTVTLVSLSAALAASPLYYWAVPQGPGSIDSLPEAVVASVAGLVLAALTSRALSLLARLWAAFARLMLAPTA